MENSTITELLREKIREVEESKKDPNPDKRIVTVHLSSEVFLKMAYLFVGINGK